MSSPQEKRNVLNTMMQDVYLTQPHTPSVSIEDIWTRVGHGGVDEGIARAKQQVEEFELQKEIADEVCRKASEEIHMLKADNSFHRLEEIQDQLQLSEQHCGSLTQQLRFMRDLYEEQNLSQPEPIKEKPKRRRRHRKDSSTSTSSKTSMTVASIPSLQPDDDAETIRFNLRRELDLRSLGSVPLAVQKRSLNTGSLSSLQSPRFDVKSVGRDFRAVSEVRSKKDLPSPRGKLSAMRKIAEAYQSPRKTNDSQKFTEVHRSPRKTAEPPKSPRKAAEPPKSPRKAAEPPKSPRKAAEPPKSPRKAAEPPKSPRKPVNMQISPRKIAESRLSPRKNHDESTSTQKKSLLKQKSPRMFPAEPTVVFTVREEQPLALSGDMTTSTSSVQVIHGIMDNISGHMSAMGSLQRQSREIAAEADIFGGAKRVSADTKLAMRKRRTTPYELLGQSKPLPSQCIVKRKVRMEKAEVKPKLLGVFTHTTPGSRLKRKKTTGEDICAISDANQELIELYHNTALCSTEETKPTEEAEVEKPVVDKKTETKNRIQQWKKLELERRAEEKKRRLERERKFGDKKRMMEKEKELEEEKKRLEKEKRVEEERKKRMERKRKAEEERSKRLEYEQKKAEEAKSIEVEEKPYEARVEERNYEEKNYTFMIEEKGYTLPTISSKLKRSLRERWARFNLQCVPFVVGTSTSPSYNIGIVIQTTLSMMRSQQLIQPASDVWRAAGSISRPITALLRNNSAQQRPISVLLSRMSRLKCPAMEACSEMGDEGWGASGLASRCTCLPAHSRTSTYLHKEMSTYLVSRAGSAPDISQAHFFASLQSRVRGLKEMLLQLQCDFKQLNQRYAERGQTEGEDTEAMKDLERQIQSKEDEIHVVLGLFKEVLSLKEQLKSLRGKDSISDTVAMPIRSPLVFPRADNATVRLTKLMRTIQSFQAKLRV